MKRHFVLAAALALVAVAHAAPPAGPQLALEVPAESRFTITSTSRVSFGASGVFTEATLAPNTYQCDERTFGLTPSAAAVRRTCSLTLDPAAAPVTYAKVSDEFWRFTLTTSSVVRFGKGTAWVEATLPAGTHQCVASAFGGKDPAFGVAKVCEATPVTKTPVVETKPTEPVTTPPVTTAPVSSDVSDPAAYRAAIATLGTDAWTTYKFGSPSTAALPSTTHPGPRPNQSMALLSGQISPPHVFSDGVAGGRGCGKGEGSWCGEFQIGTLVGWPGDYSSSIINVAYTPDATPPAGFREGKYWGVASLQTLNIGHGTVSWKPEPSWTTWIGPTMTNADNDENTVRLAGVRGGSPIGTIELDAKPVAAARGFGRGGWVNNVLTVFANGAITTSGSNTSHNFAKFKLPDTFKPTAIAITNSGEFALVTGWNPTTLKGQVAVLALADGCQWCEDKPESQWNPNWGSGRGAYPGMPGLGNYLGIKLAGIIDLPEGMKAPTEIAVTTGKPKRGDGGYERVQQLFTDHMLTAANRARWYNGELRGAMAQTGLAVAVSKSEKKAAFIDLRPLFQYYREQYVGPQTDAQWNAKMAARGPADNQFPLGFTSAPAQKPVVVKVVDLDSKPTAVRMMPNAPHRALLATEDGKLRLVGLGDGYLDQAVAKVGAPADIAELSSINVGSNPTSIAHVDEKATLSPYGYSYLWQDKTAEEMFWWVLSRGERKATMLRLNADATAFSVFRTLQDSRLTDPIALYDGANHGTESYLLTALNYSGKSVMTFSYGPLIMHTYDDKAPCTRARPCVPANGAQFEFTGEHKLPGKPFNGGLANIN